MGLVAAEEAADAANRMDNVVARMDDRQRKLFLAIIQGKDELIATLESGYREFIDWMPNPLSFQFDDTMHKHKIKAVDVTLKNVFKLDEASYNTLLLVCKNKVSVATADDSYENHLIPINKFFDMAAPKAFAVLNEIMENATSDRVRLSAADSLLNRAGYGERPGERVESGAVTVNIILPGQPIPIEVISNE